MDTFKWDNLAKGLGFELSPFLVMLKPEGVALLPLPAGSPDPTTEIPASLLSLLLALSPPLLALLGVLEIDTDLGNLFSFEAPPCEIEIPAGSLGTLF